MNINRSAVASLSAYSYENYTEEDRLAWHKLFVRQINELDGKACREFINGLEQLREIIEDFPDFPIVSERIYRLMGWKITPVTGLISHEDYFQLLLQKHFPVALFIRDPCDFDYAPLPDMWHDIFGHLPFFCSPIYQHFVLYLSRKILTVDESTRKKIGSLYWYTIEAGICREKGERRVYGASQVSSFQEISYAVSDEPKIEPFNLEKIMNLEVKNEDIQTTLFEIPNFNYLSEIEEQLENYLDKEFRGVRV
jgi:phenylalanine-4-hydroxylase